MPETRNAFSKTGLLKSEKVFEHAVKTRFDDLKAKYPYKPEVATPAEMQRVTLPTAVEKPITPAEVTFSSLVPERYKEPITVKPKEKVKFISPKEEAKKVIEDISVSPDPAVAKVAKNPTVVRNFTEKMRGNDILRTLTELKSTTMRELVTAVETHVSRLGEAGQEVAWSLARQSQKEHQLATRWIQLTSDTLAPGR